MKDDDMEWEFEKTESDGRERVASTPAVFWSILFDYDPSEGPIGSGKALAEALAEEKRRLYPNGPAQATNGDKDR